MNASLAMVVCFVGFQGIVPQSWDPASAVAPDRLATLTASSFVDDALVPTGTVGTSLLLPLDLDAALGGSTPAASGAEEAANDLSTTSIPANRPSEGKLFAPLNDLVPTSPFGFRTSPISGEQGEFHTGQDFAAPCGTPVHAADAGTVRAVGWHPWGGGNRVEVDHGNGLITTYNHLEAISVEVGDTVDGGEPIASLGTTGSSTGCHLHFETILDGEHVDPSRWALEQTRHAERKGELRDYAPGADVSSEIPAWAQSSTRSDQQPPAKAPDTLVVGMQPVDVPAVVDGPLTIGSGDAGTPPRNDVPTNDGVRPGPQTPSTPPAAPAPKPPKAVPPAPKPPEVVPPAPKPPEVVPPAPKPPEVVPPAPHAPAPPVQTPPPAPGPTPPPITPPAPDPEPVDPTDPTDPDPSCEVDPEPPTTDPSESAADGAEPSTEPEVTAADAVATTIPAAPAAEETVTPTTPTTDPSVTPSPAPGEATDPDLPPCDEPEDPADPEPADPESATPSPASDPSPSTASPSPAPAPGPSPSSDPDAAPADASTS